MKWKNISRLLLLSVCAFMPFFLAAQDFKFSAVEGKESLLNEGQVRSIAQLPNGKLAVITEGMLNLYDGANFKNVRIDDKQTIQLSRYTGFHHSYIENDRLWIKNSSKLSLIDLRVEKSENNPDSVIARLRLPAKIGDIFVDTHQDIWVLTSSGNLVHRASMSGMTRLFLKNAVSRQNPEDNLYDLIRAGENVYLFYRSGLMRCFKLHTAAELYTINFLERGRSELDRTLYVVPVKNILYQLRNGSKGRLTSFDLKTRRSKILLETDYSLNTLSADKKGNFWVSCPAGLWYFKAGQLSGRLYPHLSLADGRKIVNETSTVFCDKQEGLWVGTLNKGLFYYHPERFRFKSFRINSPEQGSKIYSKVTSICETLAGKLLIGTRKGLYISAGVGKQSKSFRLLIPDIVCNSMLTDRAGNVWIASNTGLFGLAANGRVRQYSKSLVSAICKTPDGSIYTVTADGLSLFDNRKKNLMLLISDKRLVNSKQVQIWNNSLVGITDDSPFVISLERRKVYFHAKDKYEADSEMFRHSNRQYTSLFRDKDNLLWFGTFDGLNVWDESRKKLYPISTEDGLVNNNVKGITEKEDGSIWVTTSRGISCIRKSFEDSEYQFQFTNFTSKDGLLEQTFTERAIFISSTNGFVAAGVEGLNLLPNDLSPVFRKNLDPVLLDFSLFGKRVKQGQEYDGRVILSQSLSSLRSLHLNHDQNFFSISFSGLNYINPTQTIYRYVLEGLDNDWRTEQGTAEAFYTGLAPGSYTFKLQASTDGLHWNKIPTTLQIVIHPPFWKTIYAQCIYVLIAFVVSGALARYYRGRTRARQQKRQELAVEKAKSDFLTNISHDLRTPLSLIISPLRSLISKVNDASIKQELQRINSSADVLLDTINQLLEFKRLEASGEELSPIYCEDLQFFSDLCLPYQSLAEEKEILFNIDIVELTGGIWIDRQKAVRIVNNLLSNAFKFSLRNGTVHLRIGYDESLQTLHVLVSDDGIGIQAEHLSKVFDRFYQSSDRKSFEGGSGIGLSVVKQYAEMHGGSVRVSSEPGKGATFEVTLSVEHRSQVRPESAPGHTILIVEDNLAFREYLVRELSPDFRVVDSGDGRSALSTAVAISPDLIITDMMMPEMGGMELCQAIRKEIAISHIPIIMLTARASDEAEFESYESGADAYLTKPVDLALLRLRIKSLLELVKLRKQAFSQSLEVDAADISSNPLDRQLLQRAIKLVEENLSDPRYSVEKFSDDMCMDRSGLYRKLMALTGSSPTNFIRSIRLKRAAALLSEKRFTVTQVAETVGFNSLSYFSKCFHEEFGKTPVEYSASKGVSVS